MHHRGVSSDARRVDGVLLGLTARCRIAIRLVDRYELALHGCSGPNFLQLVDMSLAWFPIATPPTRPTRVPMIVK